MPLVRKLLGAEQRSAPRRMPQMGGSDTAANVNVTPERSLQMGAVYSCVTLLSEAVSGLPVSLFERKDGVRLPIIQHPVLRLVKDEPNPTMDAAEMWRTVMGWMLLRGNAYVYIERNQAGMPIGLWPLAATAVEPRRMIEGTRRGQLVYIVTIDEENWAPLREADGIVQPENMLHYRAFGLDGVLGLSPIGLARQSIGIGFAAQQYMGGFYARDASPGSHIEVPDNLTDEAFERLEAQWKSLHQGWQNSHRLAILEGGAKWASASLDPKDAQFIETQKFSRSEIGSMYGVPPHMIGDTDKSTSWGTGIAEQGIGFVTYSLRRWTGRMERVTRRLLIEAERERYRWRWNPDGLMQGDMKARYDAYAIGKQWGWLSTNDILTKEDEAPIANGDVYLQPLNMVPAGSVAAPATRAALGRPTRQPVQRAAPSLDSTSAMVALYPPTEVAEALAVDDGLAADDLHVTLAFLGAGLTDEQIADAEAVVESLAAQWPSLPGQIGGLGMFPTGEDGVPVYAPVDVADLAEIRTHLVDQLIAAGVPVATDHGFTPHMTLTYLAAEQVADGDFPSPIPATQADFVSLSLVVGDDRTDHPFTGGIA